jgi:hypothetical protein
MDRANELLRLPGDKPRQQKLDDAINKLKKTMQAALVPLQEDYVAACNAQKWTLEGSALQQVERKTTDPADKKRAIEELLEAVRAGDKLRIKAKNSKRGKKKRTEFVFLRRKRWIEWSGSWTMCRTWRSA